eukprot:gene6612-1180_t
MCNDSSNMCDGAPGQAIPHPDMPSSAPPLYKGPDKSGGLLSNLCFNSSAALVSCGLGLLSPLCAGTAATGHSVCGEPQSTKGIVVFLDGTSTSGKSTMLRALKDLYPESVQLNNDSSVDVYSGPYSILAAQGNPQRATFPLPAADAVRRAREGKIVFVDQVMGANEVYDRIAEQVKDAGKPTQDGRPGVSVITVLLYLPFEKYPERASARNHSGNASDFRSVFKGMEQYGEIMKSSDHRTSRSLEYLPYVVMEQAIHAFGTHVPSINAPRYIKDNNYGNWRLTLLYSLGYLKQGVWIEPRANYDLIVNTCLPGGAAETARTIAQQMCRIQPLAIKENYQKGLFGRADWLMSGKEGTHVVKMPSMIRTEQDVQEGAKKGAKKPTIFDLHCQRPESRRHAGGSITHTTPSTRQAQLKELANKTGWDPAFDPCLAAAQDSYTREIKALTPAPTVAQVQDEERDQDQNQRAHGDPDRAHEDENQRLPIVTSAPVLNENAQPLAKDQQQPLIPVSGLALQPLNIRTDIDSSGSQQEKLSGSNMPQIPPEVMAMFGSGGFVQA